MRISKVFQDHLNLLEFTCQIGLLIPFLSSKAFHRIVVFSSLCVFCIVPCSKLETTKISSRDADREKNDLDYHVDESLGRQSQRRSLEEKVTFISTY